MLNLTSSVAGRARDRDYDEFDKNLKSVISQFERNREWADSIVILKKISENIEKYGNCYIPRQRDLAKRLAQCLNPEVPSIHSAALDVYKEVFVREIKMMKQDKTDSVEKPHSKMALFFGGLFSFY